MVGVKTTEVEPYLKIRILLLMALFVSSIVLTAWPSIKVIRAGIDFRLDQRSETLINSSATEIEKKRLVQQHFSGYGVYIPLDDISVGLSMDSKCGQADLSVWLPLRFKIPLVGERVLEWCLTNQ